MNGEGIATLIFLVFIFCFISVPPVIVSIQYILNKAKPKNEGFSFDLVILSFIPILGTVIAQERVDFHKDIKFPNCSPLSKEAKEEIEALKIEKKEKIRRLKVETANKIAEVKERDKKNKLLKRLDITEEDLEELRKLKENK